MLAHTRQHFDRRISSPAALDGLASWLYEGGIREPLIIYWPHEANNGTVCDVPVISTDFYATILDMLDLQPKQPGPDGMDGMSLVPLLKKDQERTAKIESRALYWHWPHYSNYGAQSPGGAIRYQGYKLIEYYENDTVQLLNLKTDPTEQHDLSTVEPDKAQQLRPALNRTRGSESVRTFVSAGIALMAWEPKSPRDTAEYRRSCGILLFRPETRAGTKISEGLPREHRRCAYNSLLIWLLRE